MQVFRSINELYAAPQQASVVSIGNFDGVHCGHQTVLRQVVERARARHARAVVVTFDPHPLRVLKPGMEVRLLTPLPTKLELLAATGLDAVAVLPFTAEFSEWTARDFAERVLRDALRTMEVHEGENFHFGHHAAGDVHGLEALGLEMGFSVRAFHPETFRGAPISSSRIRSAVGRGEMNAARTLLGRPFSVRSTPASGRGYGSRYAVPTVNLAPYADILPANGVYITSLKIGEGSAANTFDGVTNVGNRPTFGADSFAVESHLFDFVPVDLFEDTPLELTFRRRLRAERRFDSPQELVAQIQRDIARAQRYLRLAKRLVR